jgi:hypothetical protein
MKITKTDDGYSVRVRQSWINDATMCNERGRQAIVRPEWSKPNDATILGTAVHAGIAACLENGMSGTLRNGLSGVAVAHNTLNELLEQPFMRTKYTDEELHDHVIELMAEWERNVLPSVSSVVAVEKEFEFMLDEFEDERLGRVSVVGAGTIDLVTKTGLWDWKTAGRKYSAKDKQSQAVQPTMYSAAAVAMGWLEYPVTFNYGVLVRGGRAQVLPVFRNESHTEWLRDMVRPLVRTALLLGTDTPWVKNDTHYLCSQTWCSWWSICKGSKLSPNDITPGGES